MKQSPKEKAVELIEKMWIYALPNKNGSWQNAKQCALIAVNEIIDAIDWHEFENPTFEYWQEVKQEIEKL